MLESGTVSSGIILIDLYLNVVAKIILKLDFKISMK